EEKGGVKRMRDFSRSALFAVAGLGYGVLLLFLAIVAGGEQSAYWIALTPAQPLVISWALIFPMVPILWTVLWGLLFWAGRPFPRVLFLAIMALHYVFLPYKALASDLRDPETRVMIAPFLAVYVFGQILMWRIFVRRVQSSRGRSGPEPTP